MNTSYWYFVMAGVANGGEHIQRWRAGHSGAGAGACRERQPRVDAHTNTHTQTTIHNKYISANHNT